MSTILADELAVCDDCALAIANNDYSGMDDATETRVRDGIERLQGYAVIGEELGFQHDRCDCCGAKAGNRHGMMILGEAAS